VIYDSVTVFVQSRDTTELEHLRRQCTLEQQRAQLLELELVDERRRVRELSDQMKIFEMFGFSTFVY
jgi:hypothetical protein